MARRMFNDSIVCSDKFRSMPLTAQALYFQFGMVADDDGFVAYPDTVIRATGAEIGDLETLQDNEYIITFDSGVVLVSDWRINNTIKKDRYTPTKCVEEMEQVELVSKKYESKKFQKSSTEVPKSFQGNSKENDGAGSVTDTPENDTPHPEAANYQAVIDMYNRICVSLPMVERLTDKRRKTIKAVTKQYTLDDLSRAFTMAQESDFLTGRSGKWKASFDWLTNTNNLIKVLEGNYSNKPKNEKDRFNDFLFGGDTIDVDGVY